MGICNTCPVLLRCHSMHRHGASLLNLGSIVGAPCMPIVATADLCGHWWKRRDSCGPFLVGGVICLSGHHLLEPNTNHCSIPPDERDEAREDEQTNAKTVVNHDNTKKAKARIVLLGYQHPSLLDRGFKKSAPVQSTLGRNLLYVLSATHQWELQGLDLATAFLQTQPTEADSRLWTSGVDELKDALKVPRDSVLRILRNICGSTTAPRGLWLDLHRTLTSLGAVAALGERCLWLWFSKGEKDSTGRYPKLLGAMGGHVDDFHRVGDLQSSEWQHICHHIDTAYKWGTMKTRSYRHAGTDISTIDPPNGFKIVVDQDAYVESLPDLQIARERLRTDDILTDSEKGLCRTARLSLNYVQDAISFSRRSLLMALCSMPVRFKEWSAKLVLGLRDVISFDFQR